VEINEVDGFMALFEYDTQEKGMSEDEVMELFRGIAKTGAPVTYEPLSEPVVQHPNGVALMNRAPHPAAAHLFYTWILTDGQEVLREAGRRSSLQEDAGSGAQDVETILVDTDRLVEEHDLYADK